MTKITKKYFKIIIYTTTVITKYVIENQIYSITKINKKIIIINIEYTTLNKWLKNNKRHTSETGFV